VLRLAGRPPAGAGNRLVERGRYECTPGTAECKHDAGDVVPEKGVEPLRDVNDDGF